MGMSKKVGRYLVERQLVCFQTSVITKECGRLFSRSPDDKFMDLAEL
jgi:hypothetical protein